MKPTLSTLIQRSSHPFAHHLAKFLFVSTALLSGNSLAQTAPPPNFGEETKGKPAVEESTSNVSQDITNSKSTAKEAGKEAKDSGISRATVVESRRENGQVYSIELQHSKAPNQYIEETDSDGNIESQSNDLEETPNLPKWKIGSW